MLTQAFKSEKTMLSTAGVALMAVGIVASACSGAFSSDCLETRTCHPSPSTEAGAAGDGGAVGYGPDGAAGGGETGSTGGSSGSERCEPYATEQCYASADGVPYDGSPAPGQTTCRFGERTCDADGSWGPCLGAVAPEVADTCDPGNDANCNGIPNEGCSCRDGAGTGDSCKLSDGQPCTSSSDCATSACKSFYLDADKDGYRANGTILKFCGLTKEGYVAIDANKGSDCDDSTEDANPEATEVCDGIDNDCDDSIDFNDNAALTLSGSQKQLATGHEATVAAAGEAYAVAYVSDKTYLQVLSQGQVAAPKATIDANPNLSLALTSDGSNGAGVFYYRDTEGSNGELWFRKATANGLSGAPIKVASPSRSSQAVATWITGNKWLYAFSGGANGGAFWSYLLGFDGTKAGTELTPLAGSSQALATSGSTFGFLYGTGKNLEYSARNSSFVEVTHTTQTFGGDVTQPAIAARPDGGFALVFTVSGQTRDTYFEEISANGNIICGPTKTSTDVEAIVPTKRGYLAVGAPNGTLFAQEIASGCTMGKSFPNVGTNATGKFGIAKSSAGYAIVWDNGTNVFSRTFGPNLCD